MGKKIRIGALISGSGTNLQAIIDSCESGMIDGKMAKLTQELSDGARVKITTSKAKRTPSRDWLNSVKTRRAREAIRKSLRR